MEKSAEPQLYLGKIEKLNATHPDWPFALVRLGKAYLLLEDLHGALEQFEKALSLLLPLRDDKFSQYVRGLRAYITVSKFHFVLPSVDVDQDPLPLGSGG
jgi:tetratricopeptide (TPR) repeat protein